MEKKYNMIGIWIQTRKGAFLISREDATLAEQFTWFIADISGKQYVSRGECSNNKTKQIRLHRQLLDFPRNKSVDHINGDGLDNRRCNLRIVTHYENAWNSKGMKYRLSKYTGLYLDKRYNVWRARITCKGKTYPLGRFNTQEEAAKAYNNAALKYFKEFACINKIDEV